MTQQRIEISIEEAAQIGIGFLMRNQVADAEQVFGKLLSFVPEQPEALHYSGIIAHRRGRTEEGIALVRRSLALAPQQPDWHSNLGILLESTGDGEAAMREFEQAIALDPTHANAWNNLGVLRRAYGRPEEAEAAYREVIALEPEHREVYRNLAIVLDQMGRTREALVAYCKAITLKPASPDTRRMLVIAYTTIGDFDKAIETCEDWVRTSPEDPIGHHMLAAVSQRGVPARASDDFVAASFDGFAATFEAKLQRLEYKAPELVAAALAETGVPADGTRDVLDVGCGTGWCGPFLRPYARRLTGVDLSTGMLEHARGKGVYDELVHAELVAYLQQHPASFDIVVSADTLVYFGDLEPFAVAVAGALRPGGHVVFTVEAAGAATERFHLEVHGRYNHAEPYVSGVLAAAGLTPTIGHAVLRNESGAPVQGLVVRAGKPAGGARG